LKKLLNILISSLLAIAAPLLVIWVHHVFVIGLNPILGWAIILLVLLLATPLIIKLFTGLKNYAFGHITFNPALLFVVGCLSWVFAGAINYSNWEKSTFDIHFYDTYYVIANIHIILSVAAIFGIFCAIYYWYPAVFRRYLNNTMGYIHFRITFTCTYAIFWPIHFEQNELLSGMPKRYTDYSGWASFRQFDDFNRFISVMAIVLLAGQCLFIFNFFYSLFRGRGGV
jgi:cytochrome c oxidase subunit 1